MFLYVFRLKVTIDGKRAVRDISLIFRTGKQLKQSSILIERCAISFVVFCCPYVKQHTADNTLSFLIRNLPEGFVVSETMWCWSALFSDFCSASTEVPSSKW